MPLSAWMGKEITLLLVCLSGLQVPCCEETGTLAHGEHPCSWGSRVNPQLNIFVLITQT